MKLDCVLGVMPTCATPPNPVSMCMSLASLLDPASSTSCFALPNFAPGPTRTDDETRYSSTHFSLLSSTLRIPLLLDVSLSHQGPAIILSATPLLHFHPSVTLSPPPTSD